MVEAFKISGGKELEGIIEVSGAKNAVLPIVAGALIAKGEYIFHNVPNLRDIRSLFALLESLGLQIEKLEQRDSYKIINNGITNNRAEYDLVKKMRASFLVMGPMLANLGDATVSLPGGCSIGSRPVDYHLKGFEALGAKIEIDHGYVTGKCEGRLKGAKIVFDFPSVGATENVIMAAVKADGTTIMENVAREPEIEDLCNFLISMGAKIKGVGTARLEIEGVEELTPGEYTIIPDRIEAGTYIVMSLMFDGKIAVKGINYDHLESFILKLEEMGAKFRMDGDTIYIENKLADLKPVSAVTRPHPGFPTDLQSQLMTLMCLVEGTSEMKETIFENRFMHVPELNRMGANIHVSDNIAIVNGVNDFSYAEVMASDLRAGASLVMAALKADGETLINRIYHIDRGYDRLEEKLRNLGANIERVKVDG